MGYKKTKNDQSLPSSKMRSDGMACARPGMTNAYVCASVSGSLNAFDRHSVWSTRRPSRRPKLSAVSGISVFSRCRNVSVLATVSRNSRSSSSSVLKRCSSVRCGMRRRQPSSCMLLNWKVAHEAPYDPSVSVRRLQHVASTSSMACGVSSSLRQLSGASSVSSCKRGPEMMQCAPGVSVDTWNAHRFDMNASIRVYSVESAPTSCCHVKDCHGRLLSPLVRVSMHASLK